MAQPSDRREARKGPCPSCGGVEIALGKGCICPACGVGIPQGESSQIEVVEFEEWNLPDLRPLPDAEIEEKSLFVDLNRVLGPQEIELLNLLQNDLSDKDIAARQGISRENVRKRRQRLKEKIKTFLNNPF